MKKKNKILKHTQYTNKHNTNTNILNNYKTTHNTKHKICKTNTRYSNHNTKITILKKNTILNTMLNTQY